MTDNELDQLMQRVLLDAIKSDCEKENGVAPSFEPSLRYQRSLAAMIADPLKWAHKRTKPLWKKVLQKVAIVLIIFSLSLGSLMVVSPSVRAAVVNWVTEWYETHVTYRYSGISEVEKMPQYEITALPNGYTEVETARVEWPTYVSVVYQNDEEGNSPPIYLRYIYMHQGSASNFETEGVSIVPVTVNGCDGYLLLSQDLSIEGNTITWINSSENILFAIDAAIGADDILHMAESVSLAVSTK